MLYRRPCKNNEMASNVASNKKDNSSDVNMPLRSYLVCLPEDAEQGICKQTRRPM